VIENKPSSALRSAPIRGFVQNSPFLAPPTPYAGGSADRCAPVGNAAAPPCRHARAGTGLAPSASSQTRGAYAQRRASGLGLHLSRCCLPSLLHLSQSTAGRLSGVKAKPVGWLASSPALTPAPLQWRPCERRDGRQNRRGPAAQTAKQPRSARFHSPSKGGCPGEP